MADSLTLACEELLNKFNVSVELKNEQRIAITSLLRGSDVLAVLPTGFGKSLIYQMLVLVGQTESGTPKSALIVCPLKSIVQDQIQEATNLGIVAAALEDISENDLKDAKFQLVFASAEIVLGEHVIRVIKDRNSSLYNSLSAIVVDESHVVETWTGKRYEYLFVILKQSSHLILPTVKSEVAKFWTLCTDCTYTF